eukprot:g5034.t1
MPRKSATGTCKEEITNSKNSKTNAKSTNTRKRKNEIMDSTNSKANTKNVKRPKFAHLMKVPATIDFEFGKEIPTPDMWSSSKGGELASNFCKEMDAFRLVGSRSFTFEVTGNHEEAETVRLQLGVRVKKITRRRKTNPPGILSWNKDGEPGSVNHATVIGTRTLIACGKLLPIGAPFALEWLDAVYNLMLPFGSYKAPMVRTTCPVPVELSAPVNNNSFTLELNFQVYLSRLAFYLIANPSLTTMMKYLIPCEAVKRVHRLPSYPQTFVSDSKKDTCDDSVEGNSIISLSSSPGNIIDLTGSDSKYTIPNLLQAHEHQGYRVSKQPPHLKLTMKQYQLQTLAWMQDQESLPGGLNSLFWEEHTWKDGGNYYFFPEAGEFRIEKPPTVHGGLLCEEMGLGKTLEIVALILSDKMSREESDTSSFSSWETPSSNTSNELHPSNATLIIVPDTLLEQWNIEIRKSITENALSIFVYNRDTSAFDDARKDKEKLREVKSQMSSADIVLTTYRALSSEGRKNRRSTTSKKVPKLLLTIQWRRVVLDEMQEIRSSTTELAVACRNLSPGHASRWMVSGTPLFSGIKDLNGELAFLQVLPFCLHDNVDGFWDRCIEEPWKNPTSASTTGCTQDRAWSLLSILLSSVMMRHSKSQKTISGESILALPKCSLEYVPVGCRPQDDHLLLERQKSHHFVYWSLERLAVNFVKARLLNVAATNGIPQVTSIRGASAAKVVLLQRLLREASITATLINGGAGCRSQLRQLNNIFRDAYNFERNHSSVKDLVIDEVGGLRCMKGEDALALLVSQDRNAEEKEDFSLGTGTDAAIRRARNVHSLHLNQMQSTSSSRRNVYDSHNRSITVQTATMRLKGIDAEGNPLPGQYGVEEQVNALQDRMNN